MTALAMGVESPPSTKSRRSIGFGWLPGTVGISTLLVAWEIVGRTIAVQSRSLPPPTKIVGQIFSDGWAFYGPNLSQTARIALLGWLIGNAVAIALAVMFVQIPVVESALMRIAIAAYCLPIVAIGPLLLIVFSGDAPHVVIAAQFCFFTTQIGMIVGLKSADRSSLELVKVYGGGSFTQLRKVRLKSALPSLFAGLRVAAPASVLGALIAEYLGGDRGLGVAMINSEQSLEITRTWAISVVAAVLAGAAYALTALIGRLLTPWAPKAVNR